MNTVAAGAVTGSIVVSAMLVTLAPALEFNRVGRALIEIPKLVHSASDAAPSRSGGRGQRSVGKSLQCVVGSAGTAPAGRSSFGTAARRTPESAR